MKRLSVVLLALIILAGVISAGCGSEDESEKIRLSVLDWDSARFQSEVARIIIEEGYGYEVEKVEGKSMVLFQKLRENNIDILLEGYAQNLQAVYDEANKAGDIIVLNVINDDNWQSMFVVPTYMIEGDTERDIQPSAIGLETVSDLSQYKTLFMANENPGKGKIYTGESRWECGEIGELQLKAYGLEADFTIESLGDKDDLFDSLEEAYEDGEPWLGYIWAPTRIAGALDLTRLEEPAYNEAVWNDSKGCAYPSVDLFVAVSKDLSDRAPELVEMFRKWNIDTATITEALAQMDEDEGNPRDAAKWYLKEKEDLWSRFLPADVAEKVSDAVEDM